MALSNDVRNGAEDTQAKKAKTGRSVRILPVWHNQTNRDNERHEAKNGRSVDVERDGCTEKRQPDGCSYPIRIAVEALHTVS